MEYPNFTNANREHSSQLFWRLIFHYCGTVDLSGMLESSEYRHNPGQCPAILNYDLLNS